MTALAVLLAVLLLGPVAAGATAQGAQQVSSRTTKESPYARYAREHAKSVERKPGRAKAARPLGRGRRVGAPVRH